MTLLCNGCTHERKKKKILEQKDERKFRFLTKPMIKIKKYEEINQNLWKEVS